MATNQHHYYGVHGTPGCPTGDWRLCADCGSPYNARTGACRTCPTLTWAVWDRENWEDTTGEHSRERGIYRSGFASKNEAQAAIPGIIARMAEAGHDLTLADFLVIRDDAE